MGVRRHTPREPLHPAAEALRHFFAAMNEWESAVIAGNYGSVSALRRRGARHLKALAELYSRFCESGAAPERLTELNWGLDSPDYDPKTEKIMDVKAGRTKAVIDTRMTGKYLFRMRYELLNEGERGWRLRGSRKCFDPESQKWCYCQL